MRLVSVVVLALAGCTATPQVDPQPCEQRLETRGFQVCLPHDAEVLLAEPHRAIAAIGDYEVTLEERDSQEGDPDQAAFAALSATFAELGAFLAPDRPRPLVLGSEGPVDVDGADGAFQALDAGYDRGEVDDAFVWGRAVTIGNSSASVVVLRIYDIDDEVSRAQLTEGRQAALRLLVTLAPRQN